jgi:Cd2+/Zn2+-exporting ATPase
LEELMAENTGNGKLAFVGDGINDAASLQADVGIAMAAWEPMRLLRPLIL